MLLGSEPGRSSDYVADFVELSFQAGGFENFFQVFSARGFFEFRGGDFGEVNLLVGEPGGVVLDPGEGARAGGIVGEFLDRVTGSARESVAIVKKIPQIV